MEFWQNFKRNLLVKIVHLFDGDVIKSKLSGNLQAVVCKIFKEFLIFSWNFDTISKVIKS